MTQGIIKTHTILDRFVERNIEKLKSVKRDILPVSYPGRPSFFDALDVKKKSGKLALIAEIKRRSPSIKRMPVVAQLAAPSIGSVEQAQPLQVDILQQAITYEKSDATAISVLTQPSGFQGSLVDLADISKKVSVPLLRKDFLFDPYQIYEAKSKGASAVLFIVMILEKSLLKKLINVVNEIGLDALVEVHDEGEVEKALEAGAKIIGVNARDLRTLKVELKTFQRVIPHIPKDIIRVAESGIESRENVQLAKEAGADAILVGASLMKSENPGEKITELLKVS